MSVLDVQKSLEGLVGYLEKNPDKAHSADSPVTAVIEEGLRCRASGRGDRTLVSDMPKPAGGGGTAPTPGWFLRAALATCDATVIAMRAAQLGITLTTLEVTVDSESDDRGLLGMDNTIPAGPLCVRIRVRIGADSLPPERLREIVRWSETHSPVGDAIKRAVPTTVEVEVA